MTVRGPEKIAPFVKPVSELVLNPSLVPKPSS
jgi:hypothetical protein